MATAMRLKGFDGLAMSLSGLCLVHCLALPVLALSLPIIGVLSDAEWVHWMFVALAVPASMLAFLTGSGRRSWSLIGLAAIGLGLLVGGAAGWPDHAGETAVTVAGGLVLASVHWVNWRRTRHVHHET